MNDLISMPAGHALLQGASAHCEVHRKAQRKRNKRQTEPRLVSEHSSRIDTQTAEIEAYRSSITIRFAVGTFMAM